MIVTEPRTRPLNGATQTVPNLTRAIRGYVRAYAALHGRRKTAEDLGVSRHALWRFLQRGHLGRAVPSAVLISVGKSVRAIEEDTSEIIIDLEGLRPDPALRSLRQGLEEAPLLLCASPLATVEELSRFGRVPASTLRDRLKKLTERGLVDSLPHHLSVLGTRPQRRYFPTEKGVTAAGAATKGRTHMLRAYPVSKQWFRLLSERLDAAAVLYRVAAMVADADQHDDPVRVDHYCHGPYDMLLTLSGGRSMGSAAPGSGPAHFQTPLSPQEHRASGQQRDALRHPGADPRRPGHPLPGRPVGAPQDLCGDGGGASGRRPHGSRLAAVRERPGRGRAHRRRRVPGKHPGLGGATAGHVLLLSGQKPEAESQRPLSPPPPAFRPPCRSRHNSSHRPSRCS